MRNDPTSHPGARNGDMMEFVGVVTGYASLAAILLFLVALLVAGHRQAAAPKQAHALQDNYLGVEELVDLLAAEPGVPPADRFWLPRPRPATRAELDPKRDR